MGNSFSTTPTPQEQNLSLPLALVQYDTEKANAAIQHTNSDFVDPRFLVNNLVPGDMIQKKGNFIHQWFYSHFAIFIGNGEIVHVTNNQMFGNCFIAREIMVDVFSGELVRKNNHLDNAFGYHIQPLHHIVTTARAQVGQPWDYNILTHNCEHFATWCRYGRLVSLQSWGIGDLITGNISVHEYVAHSVHSIKEKAYTLWSWVQRKTMGFFYPIG